MFRSLRIFADRVRRSRGSVGSGIGWRMSAYSGALLALCLAIVVLGDSSRYLPDALYWTALIAAANLARVSTSTAVRDLHTEATLGSIVIVAASVMYNPSAVVLFAFIGSLNIRELRGEAPIVMAVFNRAMFALCGAMASLGATAVDGAVGQTPWYIVPAALVAMLCFDATNAVLLATMLVVRRGQTWADAFGHALNPFPRYALNASVSTMLSLLIIVLVQDVSGWAVLLIAIPVWLSHSAQRSAREAQERADQLAARVRELQMLNHLSTELLTVRDPAVVVPIASRALQTQYGEEHAVIDVEGGPSVPADRRIVLAGAEPAAIVLADGFGEPRAVVEALASLVGLTLSRLELERELAETERARTALTGRILEEGTHERSRIAMEVHDDVLPLFAAAQMQIDNVDMLIEVGDTARATELVEKATTGVSDGIRALRDTLEALRQSTLVPGTVIDGVRKLLADLQARTGTRATLAAPDPMPELPFAVELLAYETIRGSLANVEKHAHASSVHVEFLDEGDRLVVHMRDDGRGFDPTKVGMRSHGVALMRQRAELARGSFDISGAPDKGTTVRLEVPTW